MVIVIMEKFANLIKEMTRPVSDLYHPAQTEIPNLGPTTQVTLPKILLGKFIFFMADSTSYIMISYH